MQFKVTKPVSTASTHFEGVAPHSGPVVATSVRRRVNWNAVRKCCSKFGKGDHRGDRGRTDAGLHRRGCSCVISWGCGVSSVSTQPLLKGWLLKHTGWSDDRCRWTQGKPSEPYAANPKKKAFSWGFGGFRRSCVVAPRPGSDRQRPYPMAGSCGCCKHEARC